MPTHMIQISQDCITHLFILSHWLDSLTFTKSFGQILKHTGVNIHQTVSNFIKIPLLRHQISSCGAFLDLFMIEHYLGERAIASHGMYESLFKLLYMPLPLMPP